MKKAYIGIIASLVVVAAALTGVLLYLRRDPKPPKGTNSFVAKLYQTVDGKRQHVSTEKHFFDKNGNTVYEYACIVGQEPEIIRCEYDDLGRVTAKKQIGKGLFGEKVLEAEYYKYYKDTDEYTEVVYKNGKGKVSLVKTYEYNEAGLKVLEKCTGGEAETSTKKTYNDRNVLLTEEETYGDKRITIREYRPETNEIFLYNVSPDWWEEDDEQQRELLSVIKLTADGRMDTVTRLDIGDFDEETGGFDYGRKEVYTYYPEGEKVRCEMTEYSAQGRILRKEGYDSENRVVYERIYENGLETKYYETDFDGTDPDYPGKKIRITKRYRLEENGAKVMTEEIRAMIFTDFMKNYSYLYKNYKPNVYYWSQLVDGSFVQRVECRFYEDGKIKKYTNFSGKNDGAYSSTDYDEKGNFIKSTAYDAEGNLIELSETEITYY